MVALLAIITAIVARLRPPLWMLLGTPLLIASLVLSYRRSFWIAAVLGVLLVVLLALSPVGRRLLVPTALFVAAGIWLLGSINFQSQNPLVKRAASLSPTSLTTNVEDRYRIDERANVWGELEGQTGHRPRDQRLVERRASARCRSNTKKRVSTCTSPRCGGG